jgi:hypothetical protein
MSKQFHIGDMFKNVKEKKTYLLKDIENKNVFLQNSHDSGHMLCIPISEFESDYQLEKQGVSK